MRGAVILQFSYLTLNWLHAAPFVLVITRRALFNDCKYHLFLQGRVNNGYSVVPFMPSSKNQDNSRPWVCSMWSVPVTNDREKALHSEAALKKSAFTTENDCSSGNKASGNSAYEGHLELPITLFLRVEAKEKMGGRSPSRFKELHHMSITQGIPPNVWALLRYLSMKLTLLE